ncbi:MAG: 3-methyl-2-oxobutanoate hydroxymethyltransferase, partial [Planctomycetota bacterium]
TMSLRSLQQARRAGTRVPMLTCYDATYAALLAEAGIDHLLVGDSAANVIHGHRTTLPIDQPRLTEMANAVRRGHPDAFVMLDIAFGTQADAAFTALKSCECDAIKIEAAADHLPTVQTFVNHGVGVVAHLGLTPQTVMRDGGYRYVGRTPAEIESLVADARNCADAGVVALLLEATTAATTDAVLSAVDIPVIGCGAGPGCTSYVVVLHDLLGLTTTPPKFVPRFDVDAGDVRSATLATLRRWRAEVESGAYPSAEHIYGEAS